MKTLHKEMTFEDIRKKTLDIIYSGIYNDADVHISLIKDFYQTSKKPVLLAYIEYVETIINLKNQSIDISIASLKKVITLFKKYKQYEAQARALLSLSTQLNKKGLYSESLQSILEAELVSIMHVGIHTICYSDCIAKKAVVYSNLSQFEKAIELCHQYLSLPQLHDLNKNTVSNTLFNLAMDYITILDYKNASKYIDQFEQYNEQNHIQKPESHFVLLLSKGELYLQTKKWEEGKEFLFKALLYAEDLQIPIRQLEANIFIAGMFAKKESPLYDYTSATLYFSHALTIAKNNEFTHPQVLILDDWCNAAINVDDWKHAFHAFKEAREIEIKIKNEEIEKKIIELEAESKHKKNEFESRYDTINYKKIMAENLSLYQQLNEALTQISMMNDHQNHISKNILSLYKSKKISLSVYETINATLEYQANTASILHTLLQQFDSKNPEFTRVIHKQYPNLTKTELLISKLIKMGKTSSEIADLMNITLKNVENHRLRLRKKIGLKRSISLSVAIESIDQHHE